MGTDKEGAGGVDLELPERAKVIAVAEDGTEVTDAMVGSWCEAYEGEALPAGYRYEGPVKQGRPRMFEGGTSVCGYVREILAMRDTAAV